MSGTTGSRIRALLYKDIRLFYREAQIIAVICMPLLYAILYSFISMDRLAAAQFCFGFALSLCPLFLQAILIVSDKEHDEWQVLGRAGISFHLVIASKTVLTAAATTAILIGCSGILLYPAAELAGMMLFAIPVMIVFMCAGTLIGFVYHTMQEVVVGRGFSGLVPILIVVYPVIAPFSKLKLLNITYAYYPTGLLATGMQRLATSSEWTDLLWPLAWCWIWAIALTLLCFRFYRRESSRF